MSGAMTNFELGKSTHREYEAQFSRYWGQRVDPTQEPNLTKGRRIAVALRGALASIFFSLGVVAF